MRCCARCRFPRRESYSTRCIFRPSRSSRSAGVVNPQVGRWRGLGVRSRSENHVVAKTDMAVFNGANLSFTYTRLRPVHTRATTEPEQRERPRISEPAGSHRCAICHDAWRMGVGKPGWMEQGGPGASRQVPVCYRPKPASRDHAIRPEPCRQFEVSGLFATPRAELLDMAGTTYSFEQKFSRGFQRHRREGGIPLHARDREAHQSGRSTSSPSRRITTFSRTS